MDGSDHFVELARLATENGKVILTGRTEYFAWAKEAERVFAAAQSQSLRIQAPRFEPSMSLLSMRRAFANC